MPTESCAASPGAGAVSADSPAACAQNVSVAFDRCRSWSPQSPKGWQASQDATLVLRLKMRLRCCRVESTQCRLQSPRLSVALLSSGMPTTTWLRIRCKQAQVHETGSRRPDQVNLTAPAARPTRAWVRVRAGQEAGTKPARGEYVMLASTVSIWRLLSAGSAIAVAIWCAGCSDADQRLPRHDELALEAAGGSGDESIGDEEAGGAGGSDAGELDVRPERRHAVCNDGDTVWCREILGEHRGVVSCFDGVRVCTDGQWGPCTEPPSRDEVDMAAAEDAAAPEHSRRRD